MSDWTVSPDPFLEGPVLQPVDPPAVRTLVAAGIADIADCDVCEGTGLIEPPNHKGVFSMNIRCWSCEGSGEMGGAA